MMAKSDLSRDVLVDRALAIADLDGLEAISIRRLAKELGVTPMALYWHVENKDELLDAMGDRMFEAVSVEVDPGATWHEQLAAVVHALVGAFRRHPNCLDLVYRRIFASSQGLRISEHALRLLREAGFDTRQTADIATHALQTAIMLVASEPGAEVGVSADEQATKLAEKRAVLRQLPTEQFPYIHEMADDLLHCDDTDDYYRFGVNLFVAGARATLSEQAQSRV